MFPRGASDLKRRIQDSIIVISAVGLLISLAISFVSAGLYFGSWKPGPTAANRQNSRREVVVRPGDTLWSIAKANLPGQDPRDAVGALRKLNQLTSAEIFPGQILQVETALGPLQTAQKDGRP